MATQEELAKRAVLKAERRASESAQAGISLPADAVEEAKEYIDEAYTYFQSDAEYDPQSYGVDLAEQAVVEYARAYLLGLSPQADDQFREAYRNWAHKASKEYLRDNSGQETTVLAQRAVFKAERQAEPDSGEHVRFTGEAVSEAENYINEAYDYFDEDMEGYDPETLAPTLAQQAAIEYARTYLLGYNPKGDEQFREAYRDWAHRASKTYLRQDVGQATTALAQQAVLKAERQGQPDEGEPIRFTASAVDEAERHIDDGYDYLESDTGYLPQSYAEQLAQQAVIEYARAYLMGLSPQADEQFREAYRNWAHKASKEYLRENPGQETTALAQRAVFKAERQSQPDSGESVKFTAEAVDEAEDYIDEAYEYLYEDTMGYNPRTLAPTLAQQAAIEYARSYLMGLSPQADQQFREVAKNWAEHAATQFHKRNIDETDGRTPRYYA